MADRNETLADIVAEMRNEYTAVRFFRGGTIDSLHASQEELRAIADRIEAAWKCEREELVEKAESEKRWANHYFEEWQKDLKWDEAAFNEAVSRPNGWDAIADPVAEIRRMRGEAQVGNAAKLREALGKILQSFAADHYGENALSVGELFALAKSALAAPPRNCDRFARMPDALSAYEEFIGEEEPHPDNSEESKIFWWRFAKWLFAHAVQDGGDHADD